MYVGSTIGPPSGTYRIRGRVQPAARSAPNPVVTSNATQLQQDYRRLAELRESLQVLKSSLSKSVARASRSSVPTTRVIQSSSTISLNLTSTAARLESTGEINPTTTTAFSPTQPEFSGNSTSTPTLTGTYTGSVDDVHTFTVTQGGTHGLLAIKLDVRNQSNQLVDQITLPLFATPGTQYTLSSGLKIAFSSGSFQTGDSFQVNLYGQVPLDINPDNPFNGSGVNGPNFQQGVSVSAGSFQINGVAISVNANDSINSVLDKITNSAAGVSAVYNAATERVELTSTILGSAGQIEFSNDTSGFVNAVKLQGAVVTPGIDDDLTRPLSQVSAFSTIAAGDFSIDGALISEDPDADGLQAVIDRINSASAGVTASYDVYQRRFRLTPTESQEFITLNDGSTNFFGTLGLPTGEIKVKGEGSARVSQSKNIEAIRDFADALNAIVRSSPLAESNGLSDRVRGFALSAFDKALGTAAVSGTPTRREYGLDFRPESSATRFLQFSESDLASVLRRKGNGLSELLLGSQDDDSAGFINSLDAALATEQQTIKSQLAAAGVYSTFSIRG